MAVVEKSKNRMLLYKIELQIIKILPILIAICYLLNVILSYFDYDVEFLSFIGGLSIIPFIFIYISSFVFKFCVYHRLFLYYILTSDLINYYDRFIGIPITNRNLFGLNLIIAGIFLILILYSKFKVCKR